MNIPTFGFNGPPAYSATLPLQRTDAAHRPSVFEELMAQPVTNAGDAILTSLEGVNDQQAVVANLEARFQVDPSSVDAHDYAVEAAKASLLISLTRNVVDRAIQAYREITTLR